jgi:hypothetical protein
MQGNASAPRGFGIVTSEMFSSPPGLPAFSSDVWPNEGLEPNLSLFEIRGLSVNRLAVGNYSSWFAVATPSRVGPTRVAR